MAELQVLPEIMRKQIVKESKQGPRAERPGMTAFVKHYKEKNHG